MGLRAILLSLSLFGAAEAAAQPLLQIVGPSRPPYITETDGVAGGPALVLAQRLAELAGLQPSVQILPFQRAVKQLDLGGALYPALLRTPQREPRYVWIGKVHVDRAVFFTRSGNDTIDTIDAVRRAGLIGVLRGSELHPMLQAYGSSNIRTASTEAENARLLRAGRIDAWFALHAVGRATADEIGAVPGSFQSGDSFAQLAFWAVASRNLPPEMSAALRRAYAQLQQSGEYDRIVKPLLALETPS